MKLLLLLLIIASCGKNQMPAENDLNDSDGDMIPNYKEAQMDRYISAVVPLEEVMAEVVYQTGVNSLVTNSFTVSNKIDLENYSKDLMVRNLSTLKSNDHFSEFSAMRILNSKITALPTDGLVRVILKSTQPKSKPKSVHLIYPDKKVLLAEWAPYLEFNMASEDLNAVIRGEAHIAVTHLTGKIAFWDKTQDETIREKTYRVLLNNGVKTEIHYMSKELDLNQILNHFNIKEYKSINDENLLTTSLKPLSSEWWVREIGQRDIIIIKDNARSLSDHYLKGFERKSFSLNRVNGYAQDQNHLKRPLGSKMLLKIRGERKRINFQLTSSNQSGKRGRDQEWNCELFYRLSSAVITEEINEMDILQLLPGSKLKQFRDEFGSFWEVEVDSVTTDMALKLQSFSQHEYVLEGLYDLKCSHYSSGEPKVYGTMQVSEKSLSLNIEAFVEKI